MVTQLRIQKLKFIPNHFHNAAKEDLLHYYKSESTPLLHRFAALMSSYLVIGGLRALFHDDFAYEHTVLQLPTEELQREEMMSWYADLEYNDEFYERFIDDLEMLLNEMQCFYIIRSPAPLDTVHDIKAMNPPIRGVW